MPKLERRIGFYRISGAGQDEAGRPLELDVAAVLRDLAALSFERGERYLDASDGDAYAAWIDEADVRRERLVFGKVRRTRLPQVDDAVGHLSPLNIPDGSGLMEPIHVVFFPHGIVGSEFNFFGPRVSSFAWYLRAKAPDRCQSITFAPLLRGDAAADLARLGELQVLHLKIRESAISKLSKANESLAMCFSVAHEFSNAEVMDLILRPKRRSRSALSGRVKDFVRRLLRDPDMRDDVERFVVKGSSEHGGAVEELDLLKDRLYLTRRIASKDPTSRVVDTAAAFAAIREAYGELEGEIHLAAGVEP